MTTEQKRVRTRAKERSSVAKSLTIAGVAVGVGSAALTAALLYAGRPKLPKPKGPPIIYPESD